MPVLAQNHPRQLRQHQNPQQHDYQPNLYNDRAAFLPSPLNPSVDIPLSSTSSSSSSLFSPLSLDVNNNNSAVASSSTYSHSPLIAKLEASLSLPLYDYPSPPADDEHNYMHRNYSYSAPNRAPPTPSRPASTQSPAQNLAFDEGGIAQQAASWFPAATSSYSISSQGGQPQHQLLPQQRYRLSGQLAGHKRNSSGSTVPSPGPDSPYAPQSPAYPRIVEQESQHYPSPLSETYDPSSHAGSLQQYPKPLPTAPSLTFTDSFFSQEFRDFSPSQNAEAHAAYQLAMRRALLAQEGSGNNMGGGMGPSPTSRNAPSTGEFDEDFRATMDARSTVPKLDRTMSDIYQDELYNPNMTVYAAPASSNNNNNNNHVSTPTSSSAQSNLVSPRKDVFSERLQAANSSHLSAQSRSPTNSLSRDLSPFQPTSQYAKDEFAQLPASNSSPMARLGSAAALREAQKAEADARAFDRHNPDNQALQQTARTISPKDALLDVSEAEGNAMTPLFPTEQPPQVLRQPSNSGLQYRHQGRSNASPVSPQFKREPTKTGPRPISKRRKIDEIPQQYPFISHARRTESSAQSTSADSVPDFPAHLTSMESTRSEAAQSSTSHGSSATSSQRPASSTAAGSDDPGTYTCTYHGCTQRFETPAKLQKHKRDGHRQISPSSSNNNNGNQLNGGASAADRNSQAGPHKCERINPQTGKPCNSIFSRPYDLTRHEDTIHNVKKQKVKCQFCTEEKTFSRNDALTRHMRVVHPDVDFPGKTRRRGGSR
jgi:26S proteasome regulatory subunit N4